MNRLVRSDLKTSTNKERTNTMQIVIIALLGIGLAIAISLLCSIPVWLLWNWLMPVIFGLPTIGFWQALGLCALCSLLFKSSSSSSSK
jgi:membrane protein required for beta-lactamase induction